MLFNHFRPHRLVNVDPSLLETFQLVTKRKGNVCFFSPLSYKNAVYI